LIISYFKNKSVIRLIFYLFFFGFIQNLNASTLFLTEKKEIYDLRGYAEYSNNHLPIIDLLEFNEQACKHIRNIKPDTFSIHWFKFNVINNSQDSTWYLSFGGINEEVELHILDESGKFTIKKCGNMIPFSKKEIKNGRSEFIELNLIPQKKYSVFAKITNRSDFSKKYLISDLISFQLYSKSTYNECFSNLNIFVAFMVGGFIVILIYNYLLSITLKNLSFKYYLISNLALICYIVYKYGLISDYFYTDNTFFQDKSFLYYFIAVLTVSYVQFGRNYLQTKKFLPLLDKLIITTIVLQIVFCIWMFCFDYIIGRTFYLFFVIVSNFILLLSSFYIYKNGEKYVIYFIVADTFLIIVSALYVYCLIDTVTSETIFIIQLEKLFLISILIELMVYSFGIISNYRAKEKSIIEEKLIKESQKQEEIHVKNYELEILVRERTKKLRKAYRDLMNLNFELDTFVYRAAHDIRGPIATILGLCNLAVIEKDITKIHHYLFLMNNSTKNAEQRLKKILSINEIKSRHIKPKYFALKDFSEELFELISETETTEKIQIEFIHKPDEVLFSEKNLIQLILSNLISNSIRYSQQKAGFDSYCKINFEKNEKGYLFKVSDNGNGIEESTKDRIFEMFFRASENAKGTGLGLFIAKIAAKKLKGDITLVSWERGNTVFEVFIPYSLDKNLEKKI
jgi:signal transduction histidine kinase